MFVSLREQEEDTLLEDMIKRRGVKRIALPVFLLLLFIPLKLAFVIVLFPRGLVFCSLY